MTQTQTQTQTEATMQRFVWAVAMKSAADAWVEAKKSAESWGKQKSLVGSIFALKALEQAEAARAAFFKAREALNKISNS